MRRLLEIPELDYLIFASETSIASYELARLNAAAELRKEIRLLGEQLEREMDAARLAAWLRRHRAKLLKKAVA